MDQIKPKDRKRVRDLFAMLGSPNSGEQATARRKLEALLKRLGKTWNDLPELLHDSAAQASAPHSDPRDAGPVPDMPGNVFPPDLVRHVVEQYVALASPHDYVAVALWIIHTHVHDQAMVTPRLILTSPVRGCGKTTLLDICSLLVATPEKSDSITAALIYHLLDRTRCTLLIDEADNLELSAKGVLRAVLNSGHRKGGFRRHLVAGRPCKFSTFAPIALASIGNLTLPLMSRSVVIHMTRHDGTASLRRFDRNDTRDLDIIYSRLKTWARSATINPDPAMPDELHGRVADNWRVLIAIADAFSPAWGALAREAAIHFARRHCEEDVAVTLLRDIRTVFDACGLDRLASKALVDALNAIDDGAWSEWRGIHDDQRPHCLSQGELARLLHPFDIRSRSIWPRPRTGRGAKGYYRHQFEVAWRAYCRDADGTPAQSRKIKALFNVG
jgi:Protein of unknown function (DUF3631)